MPGGTAGLNPAGSERPESLASARLAVAFGCMLLVSGIPNTFPVLFPALLAEFGRSRAATASALTLMWIGGAALGPLAGWLVARLNPRLIVVSGLLAVAIGLAVGSVAPSLAVFTLGVGLGAGVGVGLTGMVVQAALLADAYVRRRGLAMGIAFSGAMAGYVLALPIQEAITRVGWRWALAGYVLAALGFAPVVWRALPSRLRATARLSARERVPGEPGVGAIVRSPPFWVLLVLFTTPPLFGYLATTQHTLYLTARGFSAAEASLLLGAGGVLAATGRVLFGLLADSIGAPLAAFLSLGSTLLGLAALLGMEAWPVRGLAYAYVLFLFFPFGSRATIVSVLVSRITPPAHYGAIFGLIGIGNSLGAATGPLLSGALYDWTGSYLVVYLCAMGILLVGLAALALFCLLTRLRWAEASDA